MHKITLNNGQQIDQLGLGVYKVGQDIAVDLVHAALSAGYRRFDTAAFYDNEIEIGAGIRTSKIAREEIYVTTKVWKDFHGYEAAKEAIEESLQRLNIGYVDMLLVHWPSPGKNLFTETWRALEESLESGKVRGIGVSNFHENHLEKLMQTATVVPAINQVELHPGLQQKALREFNAANKIATEAWSPIARGRFNDDPIVKSIAAKHGKSAAQIVIRWHIDLGNLVIPKSSNPDRLAENIDVFDFALDADDMTLMASLDSGLRTGPNPDEFD